jgi:large subunit ribosomal protein L9
MEVILLEKVRNLGNLGTRVNVKGGYARNYLVPQKLAVYVNAANIEKFNARRAELEKLEAEHLAKAQVRANNLNLLSVTVSALSSEEGKLYGSVGAKELAEAMTAAGQEVLHREITLPNGPFHNVGDYEVTVQVHSDIEATVKVKIVAL